MERKIEDGGDLVTGFSALDMYPAPREGYINIGDGYRIKIYLGGQWQNVSIWRRLRWLLLGSIYDLPA